MHARVGAGVVVLTDDPTEKVPTSFSIKRRNKKRIDSSDINRSQVVDDFWDAYFDTGQSREAALSVQVEHLDEQIAELQKELDRKERKRDRLQNMLESQRKQLDDVLNDFMSNYSRAEMPPLEPENEAIRNWAQKAQVSPQRFLTELERRIE